jgi:phage protein D
LEGFGVLDTEYLINKVRHRFDREGGYTAELDLSINPIQASGKVNG